MIEQAQVSAPDDFTVRRLLGKGAEALFTNCPPEGYIACHNELNQLSALLTIPVLQSTRAVLDAWDGKEQTARVWAPRAAGAFELFATREQLLTLYDAGFNVVLESAERFIPALHPLCRQLERELRVAKGAVNVEIFCGVAGSRAAGHFDSAFTLNCQLRGRKHWRLAANTFLRYPPRYIGGVLGRSPNSDLDLTLLSHAIPDGIGEAEAFEAAPGSVVFLSPGVLHETFIEEESFSVAFAIEKTECIADRVASLTQLHLRRVAQLRAPRLGAQFDNIATEEHLAAAELRRLAAALEAGDAFTSGVSDSLRLSPFVTVAVIGEGCVEMKTKDATRTLNPDPAFLRLLSTLSDGCPHDPATLIHEAGDDSSRAEDLIRLLVSSGVACLTRSPVVRTAESGV